MSIDNTDLRPRDLDSVLYHGASPDRWRKRGADVLQPRFITGCFMTPDPYLAAMYAADWMARPDKSSFIDGLIEEVFALGDPEELMSLGFIEEDSGRGVFIRTTASSASWVLTNWSSFEISHRLVVPSSRSHHSYSEGALIFPMKLATSDVAFFDCEGRHFDDLPGRVFGMSSASVSTNDVVEHLRGRTSAIWFMNLTDPAHATTVIPGDSVFVFDPRNVVFALTGERPSTVG